jgi:hypothetical protein
LRDSRIPVAHDVDCNHWHSSYRCMDSPSSFC